MYYIMTSLIKIYLLACRVFGYIFFPIFFLFANFLFAGWLMMFRDNVTLPNGMTIQREFDFSIYGTDALYSRDNKTRIIRGIEFICFNDRYVKVIGYSKGGTFDAEKSMWLHDNPELKFKDYDKITDLRGKGGCNGYFTGYLGPSYFYDQNKWPDLPPCAWRNFDNPGLKDKKWLERPCDSSHKPPI